MQHWGGTAAGVHEGGQGKSDLLRASSRHRGLVQMAGRTRDACMDSDGDFFSSHATLFAPIMHAAHSVAPIQPIRRRRSRGSSLLQRASRTHICTSCGIARFVWLAVASQSACHPTTRVHATESPRAVQPACHVLIDYASLPRDAWHWHGSDRGDEPGWELTPYRSREKYPAPCSLTATSTGASVDIEDGACSLSTSVSTSTSVYLVRSIYLPLPLATWQ